MVTFSITLKIYDIVKQKSHVVSANDEINYAEDAKTGAHGFLCEQRCNVALKAPYGRSINSLTFAIVTFSDDDGKEVVWGDIENPVKCLTNVEQKGVILEFSRESLCSLFL